MGVKLQFVSLQLQEYLLLRVPFDRIRRRVTVDAIVYHILLRSQIAV